MIIIIIIIVIVISISISIIVIYYLMILLIIAFAGSALWAIEYEEQNMFGVCDRESLITDEERFDALYDD